MASTTRVLRVASLRVHVSDEECDAIVPHQELDDRGHERISPTNRQLNTRKGAAVCTFRPRRPLLENNDAA